MAPRASRLTLQDRIMARLQKLGEAVTFETAAVPEDTEIEGNCSAVDDATDALAERWIHDQIADGNDWAWCAVTVTARFVGLIGRDYLGCCSYESRERFESPDGCYPDMRHAALLDLAQQIAGAAEVLAALGFRVEVR
jgi:hypothetical protein